MGKQKTESTSPRTPAELKEAVKGMSLEESQKVVDQYIETRYSKSTSKAIERVVKAANKREYP